MDPRGNASILPSSLDQASAEGRQTVAAGNRPHDRRVVAQRSPDQLQRDRQVIDRIQGADCDAKIIAILAEIMSIFLDLVTARLSCE